MIPPADHPLKSDHTEVTCKEAGADWVFPTASHPPAPFEANLVGKKGMILRCDCFERNNWIMWAAAEFGVALSGIHGRNVSSLIRASEEVFEAIGSSFSKALGNTFRQAMGAIFAKKEMDTDKMLKGHVEATVARCAASGGGVIVVSQDSTYYNLNGHHSLTGLGFIQGKLKGTVQHNAFAMGQAGTPQGLVYQRNWTRGGLNAFGSESDKWAEGLKAVNAA